MPALLEQSCNLRRKQLCLLSEIITLTVKRHVIFSMQSIACHHDILTLCQEPCPTHAMQMPMYQFFDPRTTYP